MVFLPTVCFCDPYHLTSNNQAAKMSTPQSLQRAKRRAQLGLRWEPS
jgi:hypothetical protein